MEASEHVKEVFDRPSFPIHRLFPPPEPASAGWRGAFRLRSGRGAAGSDFGDDFDEKPCSERGEAVGEAVDRLADFDIERPPGKDGAGVFSGVDGVNGDAAASLEGQKVPKQRKGTAKLR